VKKIADDNITWWLDEALYWRKKGIEMREKVCGKKNIENTPYYDKIVEILLEKGSYKEAIKWNKKSFNIKIQTEGKDSPQLLNNELLFAETMILLERYTECKTYLDAAYLILEDNNALLDKKTKYNAYLELMHLYSNYNIGAKYEGLEVVVNNKICGDKAINISKDIYGENSIETAEALRLKAITIKDNKTEALELFKEAIKIYMMVEDNEKYGKQIFHDIRQKWESENVLEESAKWLCKNSSKEFVLKAIKDFSESDQQKVKQALKLV